MMSSSVTEQGARPEGCREQDPAHLSIRLFVRPLCLTSSVPSST